jgi:hypothetical protein
MLTGLTLTSAAPALIIPPGSYRLSWLLTRAGSEMSRNHIFVFRILKLSPEVMGDSKKDDENEPDRNECLFLL